MQTIEKLVGCLFEPQLLEWAARLSYGSRSDIAIVTEALDSSLRSELVSKLSRLILFEFQIAKDAGELSSSEHSDSWQAFFERARRPTFWKEISRNYPRLCERVDSLVNLRLAAAAEFFSRWCEDKDTLSKLNSDVPLGRMVEIKLCTGDTHNFGRSVVIVNAEMGAVVYKPRNLAVDVALKQFLCAVTRETGLKLNFDVPSVIERGDYGWASFIPHEFARSTGEYRSFYSGIGHCLGLMKLLRGNDFHSENVVAHFDRMIIVDCETLFAPNCPPAKSGLGDAVDKAAQLLTDSIAGVGLLPTRGASLGFRGVDPSGAGAIIGEQPAIVQPRIVDEGSDQSRIERVQLPFNSDTPKNSPSPEPVLHQYWREVLVGLDEINACLKRLDSDCKLERLLEAFERVSVRYVPRATESYAEIAYMLWHPEALYKPEKARSRAKALLLDMAANSAYAPSNDSMADAEIRELLRGDIPVFSATAGDGIFRNPEGGVWDEAGDLVGSALKSWRETEFKLDRLCAEASIVSAYINDGWVPSDNSMRCDIAPIANLRERTRNIAARIVNEIIDQSVLGADGTVSWIAPSYDETGWAVRPLGPDLYGGIGGIALLLHGYEREARAGRAVPIQGIDELCAATRRTLDRAAVYWSRRASRKYRTKPLLSGGYLGLGSLVYIYTKLYEWSKDTQCIQFAEEFAGGIIESVTNFDTVEILSGSAGSIVPLLYLDDLCEHSDYLRLACDLAERICDLAQPNGDGFFWPQTRWPRGMGGFAHGSSGIGFALSRIAARSGIGRFSEASRRAFAFEDSLFKQDIGGWTDLRDIENYPSASAWCHGSVGIGLARLSGDPNAARLDTRQLVRRAAAQTWHYGIGWNFCICHGDMGSWELLNQSILLNLQPEALTSETLLATIVASLERHGPVCGIARDTFSPGLMAGTGGVAYQLLRSDPDSDLPCIATLR